MLFPLTLSLTPTLTLCFSESRSRSKRKSKNTVAAAGLILVTLNAAAGEPTSDQLEFFEKKIRPVFAEHCYKCHSAQAEKLKGGLLLDTKAALLKGGDTGPGIV